MGGKYIIESGNRGMYLSPLPEIQIPVSIKLSNRCLLVAILKHNSFFKANIGGVLLSVCLFV